MNWISVDDRLPNPGQEVLVYLPEMIETTIYHGSKWDEPWDTMHGDEITHWMPLPEPPKAA